jgi:uncharacterized membrane protein YhiD involved in acid resistance
MIPLTIAITRLAIALLFGAIIGIEREWRHKNAGIKTNTLVALGAATFAMLSNTFGPNNHNPAQIAAAVVTGIGFIGAGVIIHRGATVQGVTTAATLWVNASMGLAIGLGQVYVGSVIFVAIIVVQFTLRMIGGLIQRSHPRMSQVELHVDCEEKALAPVQEAWSRYESEINATTMSRGTTRTSHGWTWRVMFVASSRRTLDTSKFEAQIGAINGVRHIEAKFLGYQEEPDSVM